MNTKLVEISEDDFNSLKDTAILTLFSWNGEDRGIYYFLYDDGALIKVNKNIDNTYHFYQNNLSILNNEQMLTVYNKLHDISYSKLYKVCHPFVTRWSISCKLKDLSFDMVNCFYDNESDRQPYQMVLDLLLSYIN